MLEWEAYAAGIIDGEGSISINFKKLDNRCQLFVRVSSSNVAIPNWMVAHFGGTVLPHRNSTKLNRDGVSYDWALYGKTAQWFLKLIQPFCIEKAEHIRIALQLPIKNRGERLTILDRAKQIDLAEKISPLQKKGVKAYVPQTIL